MFSYWTQLSTHFLFTFLEFMHILVFPCNFFDTKQSNQHKNSLMETAYDALKYCLCQFV